MGKHAKLKEKQKWSHEKLHFDNARKWRGIFFIDPEDKEFKENIKNARKKLKTPMAPALSCKIMKKNCVNTTPPMTCFRGAKVCSTWLQRRSDDQLIQPDNKLELGTSYKLKLGPR